MMIFLTTYQSRSFSILLLFFSIVHGVKICGGDNPTTDGCGQLESAGLGLICLFGILLPFIVIAAYLQIRKALANRPNGDGEAQRTTDEGAAPEEEGEGNGGEEEEGPGVLEEAVTSARRAAGAGNGLFAFIGNIFPTSSRGRGQAASSFGNPDNGELVPEEEGEGNGGEEEEGPGVLEEVVTSARRAAGAGNGLFAFIGNIFPTSSRGRGQAASSFGNPENGEASSPWREVMRAPKLSDSTNSDSPRMLVSSDTGMLLLSNPGETVTELRATCSWKDQGWGNQKGQMWLRVVRFGETVDEYALFGMAPHKETAEEWALRDPAALGRIRPGDLLCVYYKVGGGGGHALHVRDFVLSARVETRAENDEVFLVRCDNGHSLELKDAYNGQGFKCDKCQKGNDPGSKSHHCAQCSFDLCDACARQQAVDHCAHQQALDHARQPPQVFELFTPEDYKYQFPVPHSVLTADDKIQFSFEVKASNDVHILLSNQNTDTGDNYEIVLGGWGNSACVIRRKKQGSPLVRVQGCFLDPLDFKAFWVTFAAGRIAVGKGLDFSQPFMEATDPKPRKPSYVGVCTSWGATGQWKIRVGGEGF